jgi:ribonuclease HII
MVAVVRPTFHEERMLLDRGFVRVAGLDEAGSGCWAGPVFAAAVILPTDSRIALIRDSKTLSPRQRAEAAALIKERATAWAVGSASPEEIDRLNIRRAGALAMRRALEALAVAPDHVLIDAFTLPGCPYPQKGIIRGDAKVKCIAAASIIAKTERDAFMLRLDAEHPQYGFAVHKGYGTAMHHEALKKHGPSAVHRMTYAPVRAVAQSLSA